MSIECVLFVLREKLVSKWMKRFLISNQCLRSLILTQMQNDSYSKTPQRLPSERKFEKIKLGRRVAVKECWVRGTRSEWDEGRSQLTLKCYFLSPFTSPLIKRDGATVLQKKTPPTHLSWAFFCAFRNTVLWVEVEDELKI